MRGKRSYVSGLKLEYRITPAGAGKTYVIFSHVSGAQDHPRRCGENKFWPCAHTQNVGSPPQVRGKQRNCCSEQRNTGITPAGAGKTLFQFFIFYSNQDHPRRCGENAVSKTMRHLSIGSPPQVRGKPSVSPHLVLVYRITPAGAGKTQSSTVSFSSKKDHPRRCGENILIRNCSRILYGSPPQVRGKPHYNR